MSWPCRLRFGRPAGSPDRSRTVPLQALVAAGALVALGAACGPSPTATAATRVVARLGPLEIVHPYLPDPASPAVAAVYLTVRNTGPSPDRLVSVTSPLAPGAMLMTEDADGSVGTMAPLRGLTIPAHGEATLLPGHDHVMLERPAAVKVGQDVTVNLRFTRAGTLRVEVPVVPLSAIVDNDGAPAPTTAAAGTSVVAAAGTSVVAATGSTP